MVSTPLRHCLAPSEVFRSENSLGMFLYARLVLDHISSNIFVHRDELRCSISQLPKELSEL